MLATITYSEAPRLYRQYFTADECRMLDATPQNSALPEIQLLRICMTRLLAATSRKARLSLAHQAAILTAFCHAAITMASLARYEHKHIYPDGPPDPFLEAMALLDGEDL